MSVFLVSFDLKSDDAYQSRYTSFMEQIKKNGLWWADTTSFVVTETTESIDTFCSRIYNQSLFDATKDLFLVLDANAKVGRVEGKIKDRDLFRLVPYVVEI